MNHSVLSLADCGKIDKRHAVPRHYQISQLLRKALRGARKGDKLPPEKAMAETFQVALLTLRRALDDLVRDGIIEKTWGRGIYVRNPPAPEKNLSRRVGITVLPGAEFINHPAQIELMRGIYETLDKNDYRLELVVITPEMIRSGNYSRIKRSGELSGLIVTLQQIAGKDLANIRRQAPHSVLLNRFDHDDAVNFDYKSEASRLTRYLLDLGHRRIALLNGPDYSGISKAVEDGHRAAMTAARIPEHELQIKSCSCCATDDGFRLTQTVCNTKERPSALIMADDIMALGAFDALRKMGLRCPEDVSVASFNDFPLASVATPRLTTVHIPFYHLGRAMAVRILDLIRGRQCRQKVIIKGKMMVRQSTGKLTQE